MKPSKRWLRMAEMYKRFARDFPDADFSDRAALDMYKNETFGTPLPKTESLNGFFVGKKWMDVTVSQWKEDIREMRLFVFELQADKFEDWFLETVGVLGMKPHPELVKEYISRRVSV